MKKILKKTGKRGIRNEEIKVACECDRGNKVKAMNSHTRMCGTEPRVFRVSGAGSGLQKWRKR